MQRSKFRSRFRRSGRGKGGPYKKCTSARRSGGESFVESDSFNQAQPLPSGFPIAHHCQFVRLSVSVRRDREALFGASSRAPSINKARAAHGAAFDFQIK